MYRYPALRREFGPAPDQTTDNDGNHQNGSQESVVEYCIALHSNDAADVESAVECVDGHLDGKRRQR